MILCVIVLTTMSRPARGARIEISSSGMYFRSAVSRPARGARIEIVSDPQAYPPIMMSRPARGARIEILSGLPEKWKWTKSRPARGARIEIAWPKLRSSAQESRPARGARIEIDSGGRPARLRTVAPRTGR